ncbi:MAG: NUDIX hydrolase [Acidobacteriota bacterium]
MKKAEAGAELRGRRWIYRGSVIDLSVESLRLPNGADLDLELIHHQGAAAVVPMIGDEVVMVRQYRHAAGGWLYEIPGGKLDGDTPEDCARREVEEEVGYRAGELVSLGWIWTTPGFTDEKIWLYLARDLEPTRQALEEYEVLEVVRLPMAEAVRRAASGEIPDAKTVCGLLRASSVL